MGQSPAQGDFDDETSQDTSQLTLFWLTLRTELRSAESQGM